MKAVSRRRLLWVLALLLAVLAATVLLLLPAPGGGTRVAEASYAGSEACQECHAEEARRWKGSRHDLSTQPAIPEAVVGDFDDARFTHAGVTSRFRLRDGKYLVRTDGPDGRMADFSVSHTIGVEPQQQYLIPLPGGRYQVLGLAWDSRPAASGGRRWFATSPEATGHRHPQHWTRPAQSWNSHCAECHSTNARKGFNPRHNLFLTAYAALDVACEACHGPGSRHVEWATEARTRGRASGREPGFVVRFADRKVREWAIDPVTGTARLARPVDTAAEVDTCGRCHAARTLLREGAPPGGPLLQTHRPTLLEPGLFHADGQPKADPLTWASFVQGRMHAAGVGCADCHDPHDLQLRAPGDTMCLACHAAERFASRRHHFHREKGRGASCIACHMASRATGLLRHHDHAFRVPRPDLTVALGEAQAPNACNACHADRSARWAAQAVKRFHPEGRSGRPHYAQALALGRGRGPGAARALASVVRDVRESAIVRASAVRLLDDLDTEASLALLQKAAADPEPLVRLAAATRLEGVALAERTRVGVTLLWDPVLAVRVEAVPAFAEVPDAVLASEQRAAFDRALDDFYQVQRANAEHSQAHVRLGVIHARRGRFAEARRDFDAALRLEAGSVPALLGLADLQRRQGLADEAEASLRRAVEFQPRGASARRALARLLESRGREAEALRQRQRALELTPNDAWLARAVAAGLSRGGRAEEALAVLRSAQRRSPGARVLLFGLIQASQETGRPKDAKTWARLLLESFPDDPEARRLATTYEVIEPTRLAAATTATTVEPPAPTAAEASSNADAAPADAEPGGEPTPEPPPQP